MKTLMAPSLRFVASALLGVVAVAGIGYTAWANHRDQAAFADSMAMLSAQAAEPTRYSTFVLDGVTWHQKCEQGHCMTASKLAYLAGPVVSKGHIAGIPVRDYSAIREIETQARHSSERVSEEDL
jgi:hypothetical protein